MRGGNGEWNNGKGEDSQGIKGVRKGEEEARAGEGVERRKGREGGMRRGSREWERENGCEGDCFKRRKGFRGQDKGNGRKFKVVP